MIILGRTSTGLVVPVQVDSNGKVIVTGSIMDIPRMVSTQRADFVTGTSVIPADDTIPQNTEGTEIFSLAITPTDATNKLMIDVMLHVGMDVSNYIIAALFQDTTANALAVGQVTNPGGGYGIPLVFRHVMTAGGVVATTFKVRLGSNAGNNWILNGWSGARKFGGVYVSSLTIFEYAP